MSKPSAALGMGLTILVGLIAMLTICAYAETSAETVAPTVSPKANGRIDDLELGRKLFFDQRLSADGKTACSSCHQPEHAFQDGRARAQGAFGRLGTRNTPSLVNVAMQSAFFWDGRRESLEAQALDPILNEREQGLKTREELIKRLRSVPEYRGLLFHEFPSKSRAETPVGDALEAPGGDKQDSIAPPHQVESSAEDQAALSQVARALAAFEASLSDEASPFDRFRYDGDQTAMTQTQQRGWQLFSGRAACIACHVVGKTKPALLSDQEFHALPLRSVRVNAKLSQLVQRFLSERSRGRSIDDLLLSDDDLSELGRFAVTQDPADIGKFKTPSLRNVALTAPYMHDGSVASLAEAVDLEVYYRGARDGHPLILTPSEKQDLLSFLQALTGNPTGSISPAP